MRSMKKLTALLLALVMALTLAACGGKGDGGSKVNPAVGKYMGEEVFSFDEWISWAKRLSEVRLRRYYPSSAFRW